MVDCEYLLNKTSKGDYCTQG